jgi:hypothetical protein
VLEFDAPPSTLIAPSWLMVMPSVGHADEVVVEFLQTPLFP